MRIGAAAALICLLSGTAPIAREQLAAARPDRYRSGTAFVIDARGYLITNAHVVEDTDAVSVVLDGRRHAARVVKQWYDRDADLALLKIDAEGLVPLPPAAADPARGETASVFGFPRPDETGTGLKMTAGLVNGFRRSPFRYGPATSGLAVHIDTKDDFDIQLSAVINPGNSGGPAVNSAGEVLGVVTWKMHPYVAENTGWAQPVHLVHAFLRGDSRRAPGDTGVRWPAARGGVRRRLEGPDLDRVVAPSVGLVSARIRRDLALALSAHRQAITAMAFDRDSRTLITAGADSLVKRWDLASGEAIAEAGPKPWKRAAIGAVACSPDGATVMIGSDQQLWRWDGGEDTPAMLDFRGSHVTALAYSPDGSRLIVGSGKGPRGSFTVLDLRRPHTILANSTSARPLSAAFAPDGRSFAVVGLRPAEGHPDQGTVTAEIYDATTFERKVKLLETSLDVHDAISMPIAFSRDGSRVIVGTAPDRDRTGHEIRVFAAASGHEIRYMYTRDIGFDTRAIHQSLAVSPGSDVIATSVALSRYRGGRWERQGRVRLWNAATGQLIRDLGQQSPRWVPSVVAISPNGRWLATANDGGDLKVWDLGALLR